MSDAIEFKRGCHVLRLEVRSYATEHGDIATASDLIAALRANESLAEHVLDCLDDLYSKAHKRAEDAEARILEYKSSEGHMREELRVAEAKVAELEQECQRLRGQLEDMTNHRNALQSDLEAEQAGRMALRRRYGAKDDETFGGFLERILQPPPVPQVAEASARCGVDRYPGLGRLCTKSKGHNGEHWEGEPEQEPPWPAAGHWSNETAPAQGERVPQAAETSVVRRCGNAWHTDCDLRWTHCFPLNPESAPAQGGREKVAGTPLTVEMMVEALRAGQLAWAKDDNVWDVIADELERAAKGVL